MECRPLLYDDPASDFRKQLSQATGSKVQFPERRGLVLPVFSKGEFEWNVS
jgi:hypothetical protein